MSKVIAQIIRLIFTIIHIIAAVILFAFCAGRMVFYHAFGKWEDIWLFVAIMCFICIDYVLMGMFINFSIMNCKVYSVIKWLDYIFAILVFFFLLPLPIFFGGNYILYDTLYIAVFPSVVFGLRKWHSDFAGSKIAQ